MKLKTALTKWAEEEFRPELTRDSFNLNERITVNKAFRISEIEMTIQRKLPAGKPITPDQIGKWQKALQQISQDTIIDFHVGDELIAQAGPDKKMLKGRSVLIRAKFYFKTKK